MRDLRIRLMGSTIPNLIALLTVFFALPSARSSVEISAFGNPRCDPPGRWRTNQKINIAASRLNNATVEDNGETWITKLGDCANWCCKLPPENCTMAMLEIRPNGGNCHLLVCYPTERCVFQSDSSFVTYDRSLFVYHLPETTARPHPSTAIPTLKHLVDTEVVSDPTETTSRVSNIKPRKGVDEPPESGSPEIEHINGELPERKPKTPVSTIFLYAAVMLLILIVGAFFGQKFLDCWEHRHYQRADYLLDGMYEEKASSTSCQ